MDSDDYITDITRCMTSIRIGMNWPIQLLILARVHIIGLAGHGEAWWHPSADNVPATVRADSSCQDLALHFHEGDLFSTLN